VITESIFFFREGKVTANSKRSFKNGYSLVYSNDTLPGMSGGPVLNADGQVVGVHGKGDREINSSTGTFDGPKTGFNTAIPIARFADIALSLGITLGTPVAQTIQSPTLTADDYFLSANQKYEKNDLQGALADYSKAISLDPKFSLAYNARGYLKAFTLRDHKGALDDFNQAISLNPKYVDAYYNRAYLKESILATPKGALSDYDKTISLDPKFARGYYLRGRLKAELDDLQGALVDYDQAISLNPQSAEAYNNRGLLKKMNDPQGALADYNKAISLDPKMGIAYYNRGLLKKNKLKDRTGAIKDFRTAIKIFRENGEYFQHVVDHLRALGASE
jgi:tetratricopeptide (TPR) repeat protein